MRLRVARAEDRPLLERLSGAPPGALAALHAVLAEDRDGPAGLMAMAPEGRIDPVWTAPGDRGRAAATALYDAIEAEARRTGLARLTAPAGGDLAAFLARRGWRARGDGGPPFEMERGLAPPV